MLKYTKGIKAVKEVKEVKYDNRGLNFENEINISNDFYKEINKALIYKKPTPIKIVKAIKISDTYKIIEAYFERPSTTDYNGIYKGKYIDFEAKETNSNTSFPLANIHSHQIEHLINTYKMGGISFLLIRFNKLNIIYLIDASKLEEIIKDNKKSISIDRLNKDGYIVKCLYMCPVNYLEIIDKYYL